MNALLDESRDGRIEFGLTWLREVKISPTVKALLLEEKPSNMGWGDFAVFSMLGVAFIGRILRFDIGGVIRLGIRLVGILPDKQAPDPTVVGIPDNGRKPLLRSPGGR